MAPLLTKLEPHDPKSEELRDFFALINKRARRGWRMAPLLTKRASWSEDEPRGPGHLLLPPSYWCCFAVADHCVCFAIQTIIAPWARPAC